MCGKPAVMTSSLAGTISALHGHSRDVAAAFLSGRQIVVGVICIAVVLVLLVTPVVGGNLSEAFGAGATKAAPTMFFCGVAALGTGLIAGVWFLDMLGACLIGAVLLGVILVNY
jgi:hypothetical protein